MALASSAGVRAAAPRRAGAAVALARRVDGLYALPARAPRRADRRRGVCAPLCAAGVAHPGEVRPPPAPPAARRAARLRWGEAALSRARARRRRVSRARAAAAGGRGEDAIAPRAR